MEQALHEGADVDAVDGNYGRTALMLAAARSDVRAVQKLLAFGASTDLKDFAGLDALDHVLKARRKLDLKANHEAEPTVHHSEEVEAIIRQHENVRNLARSRILAAGPVPSKRAEELMVRAATAREGVARARAAEEFARQSVRGPLCLLRSHASVNEPRNELCAADPSRPQPRCLNLIISRGSELARVVDLDRLPTPTARRLFPGLSDERTIAFLTPEGYRLSRTAEARENWFKPWSLGENIIGEARVAAQTGAPRVGLLVFLPVVEVQARAWDPWQNEDGTLRSGGPVHIQGDGPDDGSGNYIRPPWKYDNSVQDGAG